MAGNAARVTVGDAFFLVLHLAALLFVALLGVLPGFTYGEHEHMRLLRDQAQALLFIIGCLAVVFGCIRAVTEDLRRGSGPVLLSRPVGPCCVVAGKWLGIVLGVLMLELSMTAAYLWMSEVAHDALELDGVGLVLYFVVLLSAVAAGGVRHYLFRGPYVFFANVILAAGMLLCFGLRAGACDAALFDWPALQSSLMMAFAVIAFSAFLLPVAVVGDAPVVLGLGVVMFFVGLVLEHLVHSTVPWATARQVATAVLPNWQIYWVADRLGGGHNVSPAYMATCGLHALLLVTVYVAVAALLQSRTEVRSLA